MASSLVLLPLIFFLLTPSTIASPPHILALGTAYLDMDAPMAGAEPLRRFVIFLLLNDLITPPYDLQFAPSTLPAAR